MARNMNPIEKAGVVGGSGREQAKEVDHQYSLWHLESFRKLGVGGGNQAGKALYARLRSLNLILGRNS